MALTAYIVQPYVRGARQKLKEGVAKRLDSKPLAMRLAEKIRPLSEGVAVFSLEYEPDFDFAGEPELVASFGEVPGVG